LWSRSRRSGPGTRFFKTSQVFLGRALLVKYTKRPRGDLAQTVGPVTLQTLFENTLTHRDLEYVPCTPLDIGEPKAAWYNWVPEGAPPSTHISLVAQTVRSGVIVIQQNDLMYTCASCAKQNRVGSFASMQAPFGGGGGRKSTRVRTMSASS
jgi:hypothetical protein